MPLLVVRYQGGGNAGHTLVVDGIIYKLHQIPSGIISPKAFNLLGEKMYVDPVKLMQEIQSLREKGIGVSPDNIGISANAHMTLEYHVADDKKDLHRPGKNESTGSGNKQTAKDKYFRTGMRFVEFLDGQSMEAILNKVGSVDWIRENHGSVVAFVKQYDFAREYLVPFLVSQHDVLKVHGYTHTIFEGAQAIMLDVDKGQYPGITSSNPVIVPHKTDVIVGMLKLYLSSVGTAERAFMTKMQDSDLEYTLQDQWGEVGTTTGLRRELGWFDAVAARYAVETTDTDYLVGTRGDSLETLHHMGAPLFIATAYKINGKTYDRWDPSFFNRFTLADVEPVLQEMPTWNIFSSDGVLSPNAQHYIDTIQQLLDKEFVLLGTGPSREDILVRKDIL